MLEEILNHLRNYFVQDGDVHLGEFTISSGVLDVDFIKANQCYRIIGSVYNDGVYKKGSTAVLTDEVFSGAIWCLAIPKALLSLVSEIETYCSGNTESQYQSESFGGYSYTRKADTSWQSVFKSRLNQWRKI